MNTVELASRILTQLGFYQEPSKELGVDDRRDNIVHLIEEYTHPAKELTELTDGELEAIRKKAWKLADDATDNCMSYSLEFQVIYDREFARAILRKAQE